MESTQKSINDESEKKVFKHKDDYYQILHPQTIESDAHKNLLPQFQNKALINPQKFDSSAWNTQVESINLDSQLIDEYEPVRMRHSAFNDYSRNNHKELKGRTLSIAATLDQSTTNQQQLVRRLSLDKNDHQYLIICELRKQLKQYEETAISKDRVIQQLEDSCTEFKRESNEMAKLVSFKDDLISRMQQEMAQLRRDIDLANARQVEETTVMQNSHEQLASMCNDQLHSFFELNSKSQVIIERLEGELQTCKDEVERANNVIQQQHEMYYKLYRDQNQQQNQENKDINKQPQQNKKIVFKNIKNNTIILRKSSSYEKFKNPKLQHTLRGLKDSNVWKPPSRSGKENNI